MLRLAGRPRALANSIALLHPVAFEFVAIDWQVVDLAFEIGVVLLEVMSVTAREPMCLVIGLERLG
jgi:hypothetical protein